MAVLMTLADAVAELVHDGDCVALEGCTDLITWPLHMRSTDYRLRRALRGYLRCPTTSSLPYPIPELANLDPIAPWRCP